MNRPSGGRLKPQTICSILSGESSLPLEAVTSDFISSESEPTIPYSWLADLLLNYKLSQHVQFLARFREKYRRLDKANTGSIAASKLPQLLKDLDPQATFNHPKIVKEASSLRRARLTFTDAVNLVAGAEPTSPDTTFSLLEALNMD